MTHVAGRVTKTGGILIDKSILLGVEKSMQWLIEKVVPMIRATSVIHSHDKLAHAEPADTITLTFADRFRRRMAMVGDGGLEFLLDLPSATELGHGDFLVLEDGRHIRIVAADERLMRARPDDPSDRSGLARVAWHVGNRHLPCEIHDSFLVLAYDHVIADMLAKLGCTVEEFDGPFNPGGGAYGVGRTFGHSH